MDSTTLQEKLSRVPRPIYEWFGSDEVIDWISATNQTYGFGGELEKAIPQTLLKVEIKDLEPKNTATELAQRLSLPLEKSAALAADLIQKILLPIQNDLAAYGVIVPGAKIGTSSRVSIPVKPQDMSASAFFANLKNSAAPSSFSTPTSAPAPASTPTPAQKVAIPTGPQIIQKESAVSPIKVPQPQKSMTPRFDSATPATPPVPTARIDLGQNTGINISKFGAAPMPPSSITKTDVSAPRIVHYTQLKTPLSNMAPTAAAPAGKPAPIPLSGIGLSTSTRQSVPVPAIPPKAPMPISNSAPKSPLPGVKGIPPAPASAPIPPSAAVTRRPPLPSKQ